MHSRAPTNFTHASLPTWPIGGHELILQCSDTRRGGRVNFYQRDNSLFFQHLQHRVEGVRWTLLRNVPQNVALSAVLQL